MLVICCNLSRISEGSSGCQSWEFEEEMFHLADTEVFLRQNLGSVKRQVNDCPIPNQHLLVQSQNNVKSSQQ